MQVVDYILDPFVAGSSGADPDSLSVSYLMKEDPLNCHISIVWIYFIAGYLDRYDMHSLMFGILRKGKIKLSVHQILHCFYVLDAVNFACSLMISLGVS